MNTPRWKKKRVYFPTFLKDTGKLVWLKNVWQKNDGKISYYDKIRIEKQSGHGNNQIRK